MGTSAGEIMMRLEREVSSGNHTSCYGNVMHKRSMNGRQRLFYISGVKATWHDAFRCIQFQLEREHAQG